MLVLNSCLLCKVIHEYIGRDVQERNSVNMKAPAVLMLYIYIYIRTGTQGVHMYLYIFLNSLFNSDQ